MKHALVSAVNEFFYNSQHAGYFFMLLLSFTGTDFFNNTFFIKKKIFQECHRVSAGLKFTSDILSKQPQYFRTFLKFFRTFLRHSFLPP